MKKIYICIFMVAMAFLGLPSCMDETAIVWEGLVVEFDRLSGRSGGVYPRENDGANIAEQLQINLVGAHQSEPIDINYEIDNTTTAVEGVHYELISPNPVTIPPGSSFAFIEFEILDENVLPGESWLLTFNLTNSEAEISENYKSVVHTIAVSCISDLAGTYRATMSGNIGDGSGGVSDTYVDLISTVVLTADEDEPIVYTIDDMSFGVYPTSYTIDAPPGRIRDVCDTLTDLDDMDGSGVPFTISGTVNSDDTITISWSNTNGDSGTGTLTKQ
ncbi:MAG: hypothetical protein MI921_02740 [Cytophagales bacterium]|nr:hypothetical protein [Cytophagales bacterium]